MPRFVILRHELPSDHPRPSHWDFMLEADGVLRTWALENQPDAAEPQTAEALPDHRIAYLEIEGEVSGGRGFVTRWDEGTFQWLEEPAASASELGVRIEGRRLRGVVVMSRDADSTLWRYEYRPD
ncbi:MAG: hypothetical protein JNK76_01880 [Planctomycetales bacterium]|nr:hypothetical protein [Planctomycetales bacterium]MBN8627840.1 hypothetical protein [Planctomycetota bacterium]